MQKESGEIFAVSAIGAFIGAMIAMQLGFLWPLGILVGGLIGYLSFHPRETIEAGSRYLWRSVIEPGRVRSFLCLYSMILLAATTIVPTIWLLSFSKRPEVDTIRMGLIMLSSCACLLALVMGTIFILDPLVGSGEETDVRVKQDSDSFLRDFVCFLKYGNIVAIALWSIWFAWQGFIRIPWASEKAYFACKSFFLWIHSSARLVCAFGAALGALVGFAFGNAILGAPLGGLIAILAYELISVRYGLVARTR